MSRLRLLCAATGCLLMTSGALAQVDFSQRAYSSVVTTADVVALSTATQLRYFPMVDAANDIVYVGSESTSSPFDDYLFSFDFATTTLSPIGGIMETTAGLTGYRVRDYIFADGRLIVANRDASPDQIAVINTTTSAGTIVTPSNPLGNGTVRRIAHLSGDTYLVADSTGAIFSLDIVTGTSSAAALATIANLQGIVAENATDIIVFHVGGVATENPRFSRITDILGTPVTTDVTPTAVESINGDNWRNFRLGPNGEWIFSTRNTSPGTNYNIYIWDGTDLTTIDDAELASQSATLGNAAALYEIPDTSGLDVRPISATQFALLVGSRAPNASTPVNPAVMQITFGTGASSVENWALYGGY